MPERPNNLVYSRAWACCTCSRYGSALIRVFFLLSILSILLSLSLGDDLVQSEILSLGSSPELRTSFDNHFYQVYPRKYYSFSAEDSVTRIYGPLK